MKKLFLKAFHNKSLRWKIMFSIVVFFTIIGSSLFVTMIIDQYALGVISRSFRSNEELNSFSNDIVLAENALETYINYRTYESINNYYIAANRVEYFCQTMQSFPSADEVRHQEYIVHQLALSFLRYTSKAVTAHRANTTVNESYQKSLEAYQFLVDEISRLNILYMKKNSTVYNSDRNNVRLILRFYIIFFAGFFLLLLLLLYALVGSMTKPLGEISDVALRVAERDFDVPLFNRDSHDEIGNICRAFDRMIISIREYIDTIWEKARTENELREREMEMQALYADAQLKAFQSQINPHFLFNTLNTGAQLAMMEGADKTCYFIITHKNSVIQPKKVQDYFVKENPAGINGALLEGRFIYDAFVLGGRCDGVYAAVASGAQQAAPAFTYAASTKKETIASSGADFILYTTDGTDPRYSSSAVKAVGGSAAVDLSGFAGGSAVLKAVAIKDGAFTSDLAAATQNVAV